MGTTVVNGVTYVNSSGSVRWADIAATQGGSYSSLSQLRGKKWYKSDFTRGTFPSSPTAISFSSFRGTSGSLPRVDRSIYPANGSFIQSGNITLPRFNTIMFTVYGGSGGGGGGNGAQCIAFNQYGQCTNAITVNGGGGGSGGTTTLYTNGGNFSANGGGGGNQGANGANGTQYAGAQAGNDYLAGGTGNGNGGQSGSYRTPTINADVDYATAQAMWNQVCTVAYGAAGAGGAGGSGNFSTGPNGNAGMSGAIAMFVDTNLY